MRFLHDPEVDAELVRVQGPTTFATRVCAARDGDKLRLYSTVDEVTCSREAFLMWIRRVDVCPPDKVFELARRIAGGAP